MTPQIERRASPRASATYQIAYECFNARGDKVDTGMAQTVDISGHGALVEMPRGVDLDASLILWIMGPFHTLLIKGNVVHSRAAPNGHFHVGMKLTDVIEGTWGMWEQLVQTRLEEESQSP
jgi:hypothetical protein